MLVTYNDAVLRPAEVEYCLMRIIQWIADPESWNKAVGEYRY